MSQSHPSVPHAVIALDVGHSAVKMIAKTPDGDRREVLFPSVVTNAIELTFEKTRKLAERETVEVDGRKFFIGDTAITQGSVDTETGLNQNWITTLQYKALVKGAFLKLSQLVDPISTDNALILVGLPAKYFGSQKELLHEVMRSLAPNARIMVLPQPMGPWLNVEFDKDGIESPNKASKDDWGVIEVGHYTTDIGVIRKSNWIERNADSCGGGSLVAAEVAKLVAQQRRYEISPLDATRAIVEGHFIEFGEKIDIKPYLAQATQTLIDVVLDTMARKIDKDAPSLKGILVAGGAADLVFESIHGRWKHAIKAPNTRMTVAEGFLRFGLATRLDAKFKAEKAAAKSTATVGAGEATA